MADIDYGAIQRSVQDAMRGMQDDIHRLQNDIQKVTQRTDDTDETSRLIHEIDQRLERMEQNTRDHDPRSEMVLEQLANDMIDLKARFAHIEKFALQFSDYLQAKYEEEKDDREYKGIT